MLITNDLVAIRQVMPVLHKHISTVFAQTSQQLPYLDKTIESYVSDFLRAMLPNLWVNVESPYVDKVYRDSYYQYYATKLVSFSKDCIRLSFFDTRIEQEQFKQSTPENRAYLQAHYLGFLVIRPTAQNPIGRNVLAPRAFRRKADIRMRVCQTNVPATVNGIKLLAKGFPHSAQDVETITCSQTTLWAVMEYFAHQYAEYRPILPSTISRQLDGLLVEQQLPAQGLSVDQVSFLLKENGLAPRIYHRDDYDEKSDESEAEKATEKPLRKEFDALLSCYVESGIPVVIAIEDGSQNGHAVVCIGYETTTKSNWLDKQPVYEQLENTKKPTGFFDLDQYPRQFVFIDDNHPPYVAAELASPTRHYATAPKNWRAGFNWESGQITAFIVPLYRKVYLDAYEAKEQVKRFLVLDLFDLSNDLAKEVCLRMFLTSSRSYKDSVLNDPKLTDDIKHLIVRASMPKLIWVGELTNPTLLKQDLVFGVILLDATEADTSDQNALIFAVTPQKIANFADPNPEARFLPTGGQVEPFNRYVNNLN